VEAIDYQTGEIRWTHDVGGMGAGLLSTAGNLLFAGDSSGHVMGMDAAKGTTLWHTSVGSDQANGAITYELDGKQYVVVGAGDTLVWRLRWRADVEKEDNGRLRFSSGQVTCRFTSNGRSPLPGSSRQHKYW
jgi:outer membrane protein assembly factor BamB